VLEAEQPALLTARQQDREPDMLLTGPELLLDLTRSLVRIHSNSDSRRSASPARDVSRIGPAADCETLRNVGLRWGEKPLVNDSLGSISLVGASAGSNS